MTYVQIKFINGAMKKQGFDTETEARIYACNLADLFDANEFWMDRANDTFVVDACYLEVV